MAKSLPRAHYANFTVLLQELFTLLKQGYISSSTNGEVLSRTSAQERILKIAEANYELFNPLFKKVVPPLFTGVILYVLFAILDREF